MLSINKAYQIEFYKTNSFRKHLIIQMITSASILCSSGHVSIFAPNRLSDLLKLPQFPTSALYIVVGGCIPQLLHKISPWDLIYKYIKLSKKQQAIFDVCLPYFCQTFKKHYLGRYIIFKGNLYGVRLNCQIQSSIYSKWNRQQKGKNKSIKQKLPKHVEKLWQSSNSKQPMQVQFLIGQFNLCLNNLRIGLLFSEEVQKMADQYYEYQFQLISIVQTQSRRKQAKYRSYISKFQVCSLVVQVSLGSSQNIKFCQKFNEILQSQQTQTELSCVETKYYDFEQVMEAKWYPQTINQQELSQIEQIQINFTFSDKNIKKRSSNLIKNENIQQECKSDQLQGKNNRQQKDKLLFDNRLQNMQNEHIYMQKYFKRIYKILIFSENAKIIVPLNQDIRIINFLSIIQTFYKQVYSLKNERSIISLINQKFVFLDKGNQIINQIVQRNFLPQFNAKQAQSHKQLKSIVQYYQNFKEINEDEFTLVIHPDQNQLQAIKFLNNVDKIKYKNSHHEEVQQISLDSDSHERVGQPGQPLFCNTTATKALNKHTNSKNPLKTFVNLKFFSEQQNQALNNFKQIEQMVQNKKYYEFLREKIIKKKKENNLSKENYPFYTDLVDTIHFGLQKTLVKLEFQQKLIPENNLEYKKLADLSSGFLFIQFQKFKNQINSDLKHKIYKFPQNYESFQQYLFAHFFLRIVTSQYGVNFKNIQLKQNKNNFNLFQQLLVIKKSTYLDVMKMIKGNKYDIVKTVHYIEVVSKISVMQNQYKNRQQCHLCAVKLPRDLIFQCQSALCRKIFCFKCLKQRNLGQQFYQKFKQKNSLKKIDKFSPIANQTLLCLVCQNLCQCRKCCSIESNLKMNKLKCHFCSQYSANQLNCSDKQCSSVFCIQCCIQIFQQQNFNFSTSQWICYVCKNQCGCFKCKKYQQKLNKQQGINVFEDMESIKILQLEWKQQQDNQKRTFSQNKTLTEIQQTDDPQQNKNKSEQKQQKQQKSKQNNEKIQKSI